MDQPASLDTFMRNIHQEWLEALQRVLPNITQIERTLEGKVYNPSPENVLRVLRRPLSEARVAIFGQDPYPSKSHAMGLAFSVPPTVSPLPPTLKNIFHELTHDIECSAPTCGDLTPWTMQGVLLVNRILTAPEGTSEGHANLGWQIVTDEIARILGEQGVIAILWGNYAKELSSYFSPGSIIRSVHPSPLSAHRGFFGSKPFSKTNQLLLSKGREAIDWSLN